MRLARIFMIATLAASGLGSGAQAQQVNSRLFQVTKSHLLKVCTFDGYYAIAYRDPQTGQLEGIDVDLAQALARSLDAKLQFVETNFGTFIADVQTDKCDVAMFGIGITLKRAQAVEFTHPYLQTGIYAVVRKGGPIKSWADIDKPGVKVAVTLGSYIEPFMRAYLKHATLVPIAPSSITRRRRRSSPASTGRRRSNRPPGCWRRRWATPSRRATRSGSTTSTCSSTRSSAMGS
jgi:ABC-type amino acid transport substrate-binding protein